MHEWSQITSDPTILDIVQHCHLNINVDDIEHLFSGEVQYNFNVSEQQIISKEINKLLTLKVLQVVQREAGQIISPIFLRRKKNGEARIVLNLKDLNTHIPYIHFKMENFEQAVSLINTGDVMASVDLRHAYYSVPIAEEQQKFFCFKWQDTVFQFTCLPNGVAEGPRLFTKLMKPVYAALRKKGYGITSFIDDTLICNRTRQGCLDCIEDTVQTLRNLGFCINLDKSVLVPTRCIEYLGNIIDTNSMTVYLPIRRVEKIVQGCKKLLYKERDSIREVARITGLMVAAFPAVTMGKLHYRELEKGKIAALQKENGNFDKIMCITRDMKVDLTWWVNNIATQSRQIIRTGTEVEIYTDASSSGWGGLLDHQSAGGSWSVQEKQLHINALELKAIHFTLQTFSTHLRGKHIQVFCDNTTAVSYVNEMGGTKSLICNKIATAIWEWCVDHNAWVTCSHIPGKDNVRADLASRRRNDRHEWKLDGVIFQELCAVFGTPSIDLFASRLNKQVDLFCSWTPDPEAAFCDAFSITWSKFKLCYMFPPFSLIIRCLQKMRAEEAEGWMVVPLWPTQPWMGMLLNMLVEHPRILVRRRDILTHPSSTECHPIMRHTQLMACKLSGTILKHEAYLQKLQTSSWHHGNQEQPKLTQHTLAGGHSFVIGDKLIPVIQM